VDKIQDSKDRTPKSYSLSSNKKEKRKELKIASIKRYLLLKSEV